MRPVFSHLETLDGQGPLLLQPCAITWVLHYQGPSSQSCCLEFFFVRKALPICLRKEEKTHSTSLRIATCCARHARCFEQQVADLRPHVPSRCKQLCSAVVVQGVQKNPCACTQHSGSKMLTSVTACFHSSFRLPMRPIPSQSRRPADRVNTPCLLPSPRASPIGSMGWNARSALLLHTPHGVCTCSLHVPCAAGHSTDKAQSTIVSALRGMPTVTESETESEIYSFGVYTLLGFSHLNRPKV